MAPFNRFFQYYVKGGNRSVVLPAAGNGYGTSLNNLGSNGNYWSSSFLSSANAYNLNFNSGAINPQNNNNRFNGFSVRAVQHLHSDNEEITQPHHNGNKKKIDKEEYMSYTLTKKALLLDLYAAFACAKRHKAKKSYVCKFEKDLDKNLRCLCDELYSRQYNAEPSSCFIVERPKKREVFAAQFRDRIVHHLYYNYTHELYERTFIKDCYSCIPKRGTHYGIDRLAQHIRKESRNYKRDCYALKLDLRGYFMHINRKKMLKISVDTLQRMSQHRISKGFKKLWCDILDFSFLSWMTKKIVMLDPTRNCKFAGRKKDWEGLDTNKSLFKTPKGCGLPIGNLTSQLLSNVYLNVFDQYMKRVLKCKHYGRYVDDSYVIGESKKWLLSLVSRIRDFLRKRLNVDLHMGKLQVISIYYGVEFLGGFVKPFVKYISNGSLVRMLQNIGTVDYDNAESVYRSINSFLGILFHYSSFNIRCEMFLTENILKYAPFSKDMTKLYKPIIISYE